MKGAPRKTTGRKASTRQPDPAMVRALSLPADLRCKGTIYHTTRIPAKSASDQPEGKISCRFFGKR